MALHVGERVRRTNRRTGTVVSLFDTNNDDGQLDPDGGRWVTVCNDHGTVCNHETRKLAEWFLSYPDEWCDECRDLTD